MTIAADFTVTERVGDGYLVTAFIDASTGAITERKWILGDGTVIEGNLTYIDHVYKAYGKYSVTLIARDVTDQSTMTKTDYIIVNEQRPVPNLVIMQSFNPSGDYWRFYIDTDLHLVYESRQYIYRSGDKVVDIKKWTFVEFDVLSEKMYVGSYASKRKEIAHIKLDNLSPLPIGERITEVAPKSNLKLDELKVWGVEKDLLAYSESGRSKAAYLDSL